MAIIYLPEPDHLDQTGELRFAMNLRGEAQR